MLRSSFCKSMGFRFYCIWRAPLSSVGVASPKRSATLHVCFFFVIFFVIFFFSFALEHSEKGVTENCFEFDF